MAGKKPATPVNEAAKAASESGIYLDPKLAEIRDAEMAKLATQVVQPREPATIDPKLVEIREAEIKKGFRTL